MIFYVYENTIYSKNLYLNLNQIKVPIPILQHY